MTSPIALMSHSGQNNDTKTDSSQKIVTNQFVTTEASNRSPEGHIYKSANKTLQWKIVRHELLQYIQIKSSCRRLHDSIVVSIPACHAADRGSIPRRGVVFFFKPSFYAQCSMDRQFSDPIPLLSFLFLFLLPFKNNGDFFLHIQTPLPPSILDQINFSIVVIVIYSSSSSSAASSSSSSSRSQPRYGWCWNEMNAILISFYYFPYPPLLHSETDWRKSNGAAMGFGHWALSLVWNILLTMKKRTASAGNRTRAARGLHDS